MNVSTTGARRSGWLNYLSLFTSLSTLLCCALPSLLVLLGLGATVASVLSRYPGSYTLASKAWMFHSGTLIALSFFSTYYIAPRLRKEAVRSRRS